MIRTMTMSVKEINRYFKDHEKEAKETVELLLTTLEKGEVITVTRAGTTQYVILKENGQYYVDAFLIETMEPIRTKITEEDCKKMLESAIIINYQSIGKMLSQTESGGYIFYNNFGIE